MTMTTIFNKHYVYVTQEVSGYANAITKVFWSFRFVGEGKTNVGIGSTEFDLSERKNILLADSATDADIEQAVKDNLNWEEYSEFHKKQLEGDVPAGESEYFGDDSFNPIDSSRIGSVDARQVRLALHEVGLLDSVENAINSLPEPDQRKARIEWEYSSHIKKSFLESLSFSTSFNTTSQQIDELFALAVTL